MSSPATDPAYSESIAAAVLGFASVVMLWGAKHIGDSLLPGIGMVSKEAVMGVLGLMALTTCVGLSAKLANDVANDANADEKAKGLSYTSIVLFVVAWALLIAGMFAPIEHKAKLGASVGVFTIVAASCAAATAADLQ